MTDPVADVLILGSGPAGLTAAIYAARADLRPVVLEGEPSPTSDQPGGQLMTTTEVENFPGFPEGVMGPALVQQMRDQAERFGADIRMERATRVDLLMSPFKVWTGPARAGAPPDHLARTVIVATGAQALTLGLDDERRLTGRGVSTCATCDGFFFRDEDIAVVGGGDSALEEALFLTRFARSVTVVHRRKELRASKIMQARAEANERIRFVWDSVVDEVRGGEKLEGLVLRNVVTGALSTLSVTGLFVAIGHRPTTELFRGQLALADNGYLVTGRWGGVTSTSVPGVFACGDVQDDHYRQAITAAGSGCQAALDAERYLAAWAAVEDLGDAGEPVAPTLIN